MSTESIKQTEKYTQLIKVKSNELGFTWCGISKAEFLETEAPRLENWLNKQMHGQMGYMANHFDKRLDPSLLVPGAKTVISLLFNYHNPDPQEPTAPKLSQYARGEDYHFVLKRKLKTLLSYIEEKIGAVSGRVFVDSAPVLERAWAQKSGLGWIGKNTQLINPKSGSWFFLAELIIDLELTPDSPIKDYCGTCTACIDACPTEAITPYQVNGSKCISYFTIELKEEIPTEVKGKFENWAFGCDICQEVCPWNRFSKRHSEPAFEPHPELLGMNANQWTELTEEVFSVLFRKSAVKRTKYAGLMRNIRFLKEE